MFAKIKIKHNLSLVPQTWLTPESSRRIVSATDRAHVLHRRLQMFKIGLGPAAGNWIIQSRWQWSCFLLTNYRGCQLNVLCSSSSNLLSRWTMPLLWQRSRWHFIWNRLQLECSVLCQLEQQSNNMSACSGHSYYACTRRATCTAAVLHNDTVSGQFMWLLILLT